MLCLFRLFVPFLVIVAVQAQQRCHVCVPTGGEAEVELLFPGSSLVSCLHATEVKDCPTGFKGCLTQIKGGSQVTRTCAQFAVNACMPANGVEYCYCTGQLCNSPPLVTVTDDEDLAEGSGQPPPDLTTSTTRPPLPTLSINKTRSGSEATTSSVVHLILLLLVTVWR